MKTLFPLLVLSLSIFACKEDNQGEGSKLTFKPLESGSETIHTGYEIQNANAVVGGDMLFPLGRKNSLNSSDEGLVGIGLMTDISNSLLWPMGRIPYEKAANLYHDVELAHAIKQFERTTKVRLVPKGPSDRTWLSIQTATLPYGTIGQSFVGRVYSDGAQEVLISPSVPSYIRKYNLLHELAHAVGLKHEFQRPDRTNFIHSMANDRFPVINGSSVRYLTPYDYASITHYFTRAVTLIRKKDGSSIPDNPGVLSAADIAGINELYKNAPATLPTPTPTPKPNPFRGYFDGVFQNPDGTRYLAGWACRSGASETQSINVAVYGLVGYAHEFLGSFPANLSSEQAISNICLNSSPHRFSIPLERLNKFKTKPGMKLAVKIEFPANYDDSIFPMWEHSVPNTQSTVAGFFDAVVRKTGNSFQLSGWSCVVAKEMVLQVRLATLVGGPQSDTEPIIAATGSRVLGYVTPTIKREASVQNICKNGQMQGFTLDIPTLNSAFFGGTIYVDALTPDGLYTPLTYSGKFKFPLN